MYKGLQNSTVRKKYNPVLKIGKKFEQTPHQRRYVVGQSPQKKMPNLISRWGNAN